MTTPQGPGDAAENQSRGSTPATPAVNEQELTPAARMPRPASVTVAYVLWLVLGGTLLLGAVMVMMLSSADLEDGVRKALEDAGRRPTEQEVKDVAVVRRWAGIIYYLTFVLLIVGFALPMRAGATWARTTLCVVGGLLVVLSFFFGSLLVTLIGLVLVALAVFMMFRPDSNQYFLRGRARR